MRKPLIQMKIGTDLGGRYREFSISGAIPLKLYNTSVLPSVTAPGFYTVLRKGQKSPGGPLQLVKDSWGHYAAEVRPAYVALCEQGAKLLFGSSRPRGRYTVPVLKRVKGLV